MHSVMSAQDFGLKELELVSFTGNRQESFLGEFRTLYTVKCDQEVLYEKDLRSITRFMEILMHNCDVQQELCSLGVNINATANTKERDKQTIEIGMAHFC